MATARDDLARAMDHATITSPRHIWVSNADGGVIGDAETIRRRLIDQICLPVRWDRCIDTLSRLGVTATIELAPGGVLTGLVRRALPHVQAVALRTPDDLDAATRVVREHGVEATASPMPWHVVVAPTRGLVRLPVQQVDDVCAGDLLGQVLTRTEDVPVLARQPGRLLEWLVSDGDPVSDGQPLARLAPVGCS
jgi:[acyl-carrier-protein] S-malonyltransferase